MQNLSSFAKTIVVVSQVSSAPPENISYSIVHKWLNVIL